MTARRSLAAALILLSALDALTTWIVLRARAGEEANPIAREAMSVFGLAAPVAARVVLGVLIGAAVLRVLVLAAGRLQLTLAWSCAAGIVAWWAWIAVGNLRYV